MTAPANLSVNDVIRRLGEVPRPEHPRPDRLRERWANLNGAWEFALDPADEGLGAGWSDGRPLSGRIVVPFCVESALSGVHDEDFHCVCWYARNFDVPESLLGGRLLLHFGAVDYAGDVWLNGRYLGHHEGGYDPFYFDITEAVEPTANRLCVRVHDDPQQDKPHGKQSPQRFPSGCSYMRVTGIWQTVWLEAVGKSFIRDWVATADPDTSLVTIRARIDGPDEGLRMAGVISRNRQRLAYAEAAVTAAASVVEVSVSRPELWSPQNPALYDVELSLIAADDTQVDRVSSYVGFRKIETAGGMYRLNGEPFFLLSALDQGYNPDGLYTPPTDEFQREDVEWAKRYGLNSIRKHQIVPEPRFYYWCDILGLTVWGEMADWGDSLLDTERFGGQWEACLQRDINHPCIITWIPTNERTAPDDDAMIATRVRLYEATHAQDPTRPVIDTSGYCHTLTDIVDLHVNPPDGESCRQWWREWRESIARTGNFPAYPDRPTFCKGFGYEGQPVVFSETGNWRISELEPLGPWEPYGYGPVATLEEFLALYEDFFLALIAEPDCAGFSYVQLYDVEGEVNGYLGYDRKPKMPAETIAAIHAEGLRRREVER